jgi:hypothetical protein
VNHIPETIQFTVSKPYLGRDDLLLLDIIAQNDWERPLYFVYPHLLDNIGLGQYLHREGILYRFLPFTQDQITLMNNVRAVKQYALFMNQFRWGNVEKSNVFLDHTNTLMTSSLRIRQVAVETAHLLIQANEKGKAKEVLDKAMLVLPPEKIPFDWFAPELVKAYHLAGYEMEANQLKQQIIHNQTEIYQFYESHGIQINQNNNMQLSAYVLQQLSTL